MNCPRCQHDNPAGVKFCGECGARLESICASCAAANPPGNKFCGQCGSSLVQAATSAKFASPEAYTPKHLAEKILTSKSALEGERKQVTVLFADMKGSMELLADRDPEEARKLLDPVIEHMMEAVHRYEGTVSNLMGDGIMALFGAPLSHEDHAVRACYAAFEDAGVGESICRRSAADRRCADSNQSGFEFRRSRGRCHRQRLEDGLHGDRPDGSSRFAHGTDGDAGIGFDDAGRSALSRRLRAGEAARSGQRQGIN